MKINTSYFIILISLLLISCGGKEGNKTEPETSSTIDLVETVKDMQENRGTLVNETPLTKEEFAAWLPETLLGMPLSSSTINMIPGLGSCGVTYNINNRRVRVMVIDGAGEKGNNAVNTYRMSSTMEYDEKGSWGSTKTTTLNGLKVKESVLTNGKYNLSMFYDSRFAVDVETYEVGHEELQQIIKELNLEQLK
ncbi:hypothetical protein LDL77_10300 [Flagellimonas marinaquae]|uniref:hypothetical protein n=1 Tax=Flagellimonas aurea TaxID=2915619 RepID=UPI001CE19AEF|nr:hypothetical protein LDL77_10300 [Allomuricauda aquimarina]